MGGNAILPLPVAFIVLASVCFALPTDAQSDEICVAYMKADAAYKAAEKEAKNEYERAEWDAHKETDIMFDRLFSEKEWEAKLEVAVENERIAEEQWNIAKGKGIDARQRLMNELKLEAKAIYVKVLAAQEKKDVIEKKLYKHYRYMVTRLSTVEYRRKKEEILREMKIAEEHWDLIHKKWRSAENKWRNVSTPLEVVESIEAAQNNFHARREERLKIYSQYAEEKNDVDARNAAKRKVAAAYKKKLVSIKSRKDAAIEAAKEAWFRAYVDAYQGATNDIESVFAKLVMADRERCRARFGQ